ncbi:alpha-amylase family glycosyl hydrolase [Sphaerochaeta halotolerans]|uniref:alpha-amylase family glycosyl hydrolase n=1 Tax=Sphaerochaeta halotolerans TaxID=2293840 RepID=UPI00136B04F0|nr:alpha-amylase family glycosyl hydrolase [Sphaerochaeta halotolerans]MXI87403.1 alpha-glucosidase [Sphaerochaeta halotolerans]
MATAWWEECIVYQIYPRSFQDTNGDGIGDLQGIIKRMDYLVSLGIDAIWLNPIYCSPMADFGYDITDYQNIDPIFGTLEDSDQLLREAHKRNIRVIFDMVLNHTSIEHPWFQESRLSKDNAKADYYIWSDTIPNNWQGAFGKKAWTYDDVRKQYYLHSFLEEQPDLNWRNQEVVDAMFSILRFWLDRGVDGFRLDVINCIVKDKTFRSNPKIVGSRLRPYDMQRHIFDRNRPGTHQKLRMMRHLVDSYQDRMLVGEILAEIPGEPELAASFLGRNWDELHLSFDFSLAYTRFNAVKWQRSAKRWCEAVGKNRVPSWVLNNHDISRLVSRLKGNIAKAKLASLFLLTQRGSIFLYYGEELGLPDSKVPWKSIHDPVGKRYWPVHPGRDPARGPMIWTDEEGYGFSDGNSWLPFAPDAGAYAVAVQEQDVSSMLNYYRALITMRKEEPIYRRGTCAYLNTNNKHTVCYLREYDNEKRMILLNFSGRNQNISMRDMEHPKGEWTLRFSSQRMLSDTKTESFVLQPWQGCIYSLKSKSS